MTQPPDEVVLLADDGTPVGTAPRATVHHEDTPLHLAFSCYLLDDDGRVLLTRRALVKRAWPGVWTNAFCGHPRPGETFEDAIHRYARHELGTTVTGLRPLLPDFRYRAVDASGVVENEVCPVYVARVGGPLEPNPDEVMDHRWVGADEMVDAVARVPWALSPWMVLQVGRFDAATLRAALEA
ncbi:isopentenyl-diphosphate Delta-isomerase [Isoptericola variabilis]|uniref:Isopentenyl-diphosphate Delta-isomerase n=1 Tax=Isoptericola variabilis (strain 225) TaxID=743718 RepID=F6FVR8_ISOV2|nr:isopentenyl-diphosphate Delta-isomerase [Isoptericola variabilis]AEG45569.1 Isopentenyl-diphosphate Delta-isomerase [Isoptericola variabilis 225]TWH25823.1 isopentenyl-diphosphate delta-isomerase [Isoptericola variabilis J7]